MKIVRVEGIFGNVEVDSQGSQDSRFQRGRVLVSKICPRVSINGSIISRITADTILNLIEDTVVGCLQWVARTFHFNPINDTAGSDLNWQIAR